jgi:hypothetical protein
MLSSGATPDDWPQGRLKRRTLRRLIDRTGQRRWEIISFRPSRISRQKQALSPPGWASRVKQSTLPGVQYDARFIAIDVHVPILSVRFTIPLNSTRPRTPLPSTSHEQTERQKGLGDEKRVPFHLFPSLSKAIVRRPTPISGSTKTPSTIATRRTIGGAMLSRIVLFPIV